MEQPGRDQGTGNWVDPSAQLPPRRNPMPTYRKPVRDGDSRPAQPVGYGERQETSRGVGYRRVPEPMSGAGCEGYAAPAAFAESAAAPAYAPVRPEMTSAAPVRRVYPPSQDAVPGASVPWRPVSPEYFPARPAERTGFVPGSAASAQESAQYAPVSRRADADKPGQNSMSFVQPVRRVPPVVEPAGSMGVPTQNSARYAPASHRADADKPGQNSVSFVPPARRVATEPAASMNASAQDSVRYAPPSHRGEPEVTARERAAFAPSAQDKPATGAPAFAQPARRDVPDKPPVDDRTFAPPSHRPGKTASAGRGRSYVGAAEPEPFDEPGVDPSLAQERSENVYSRSDRFWDAPPEAKGMPSAVKTRAGSHALMTLLVIVAVVVAVGLLLRGTVFRVHSALVEGNTTMTDAEVLEQAGIAMGDSILSLNQDDVSARLSQNRYLVFLRLDKQMPDSVTLYVRERTPAAVLNFCGIDYVLDSRGMVLEESEDADAAYDVAEVRGLNVKECRLGKTLTVTRAGQMDVMEELLLEMRVLGLERVVTELNLSDVDNIYLVTVEGFSVRMGDGEDIHAKLRSLSLTRDELNKEGDSLGTIDVSNPVYPTYIPEST